MSLIGTWPTALRPTSCKLTPKANQRVNASADDMSEQAIDMFNDRWLLEVVLPVRTQEQGAAVEAFDASFREQTNWIAAWHFMRPVPRGTMRGSPTLSASVLQGAGVIPIQTTAGATLLAGDMIGLPGSLLLMVQDDVTADGAGLMSVNIVNRLRVAQAGGVAVAWNKPTANFRKLSSSGVGYKPGYADELSLRFGEKI
ncbi:MAG: hypothetical protein V4757_02195 [Pseudomonadota bacterium]